MPIVFYSKQDVAGSNIAGILRSRGASFEIIEIDGSHTHADWLSDKYASDLFVFASRHRSETGSPCLTVHAPGNWGSEAQMGGNPRELALTSAKALAFAFRFLASNPLAGFTPFLEVSHHGPTALNTPCLFVEVGSSEKEWANEKACGIVADAIDALCKADLSKVDGKVCLGFGGTHYCPKFKELALNDYAFSHIASKYALDFVDEAMIKEAVRKTVEPVETAVIDWKGCSGPQRKKLIIMLEALGLSVERA
ncbi:MAG: D-aminoacyl-tRNA deacylase [Candidatus Micrarchaeota archaeon]